MVRETAEELRRKLADNVWLTSGQIATLVDKPRATVHRRLAKDFAAGDAQRRGTLGGRNYEWHPDYVRALADELTRVQGGESPAK